MSTLEKLEIPTVCIWSLGAWWGGLESLWVHHIPEFLRTFAKRGLQDRTVGKQVATGRGPLPFLPLSCLLCPTGRHLLRS